MSKIEIRQESKIKKTIRLFSVTSIATALLVLIGWTLNITIFKNAYPGLASMKPNTALCIMFLGVCLGILSQQKSGLGNRMVKALSIFVLTIGFLTLLEYVLGIDLRIDDLIFRTKLIQSHTSESFRMGPNTALNFLLLGLSFFLSSMNRLRLRKWIQTLTTISLVVSLVALIGYLYNVDMLYRISNYTTMALHTTIIFITISIAQLLLQKDFGVVKLISDKSIGGSMLRQLLPAVTIVPVTIGWFRLLLQRHGYISTELGVAIVVLSITMFFIYELSKSASLLNKTDQERQYYFNMHDQLLVIAEMNGYFKSCNPAFQKLLGYNNSELTTRPFVEFLHPDDVAVTIAETGRLNEGVESLKFENRYRCKNGSYRWFLWSASLFGNEIYCLARDITEYKIAEEKLEARENYFRQMCEVMPQIVWTSEPDGNVDFYNRHWYEYTGMTLEQTQGWGWTPVIHPDDLQKCVDRWTRALETGENYEVEYRFKRASDGKYRWQLGRALPMIDSTGKIVKWFGTCTDIDDQKRASERLEQQVEERTDALKVANLALIQSAKMTALGEMASGVAHEINNPLAIITENAALMKEMVKSAPINLLGLTKNADKIESTAFRIAKIVEGLRTFSREGSNSAKEESSCRKIVEDTLEFCRERFRLHKIKLTVSDIPVDLKVACRPTQISQVLLNLLNNAFHAAETLQDKWVKVELTSDSEDIRLSVTDSGNGISSDDQRKIFQPFFTTKPIGKGTGLGLSISMGIIEAHQGRLFLDQTCSNTRFVISLPIRTHGRTSSLGESA